MSKFNHRSGRSVPALLASTVLSTVLLGATGAAHAAEAIETAQSFQANAGANGCGIRGNRFLISGEFPDTASNEDLFQRILADANGNVLVRSVTERVVVGDVARRDNGSTLAPGSYALPIQVGYADTGSASPMPEQLIGLSPVPNSVLVDAGGVCEQIVNGTGQSNQPPVADAGPDQVGVAQDGVFAFLDGRNSSDPDGDTLSYEWRQIAGPTVPLMVVAGTNGGRLRVGDPPQSNSTTTLTFRLTVRDGNGGETTDDVSIVYNPPAPNRPPVADAGPDQRNVPGDGTPTILDASASDPDGDAVTLDFRRLSGPVTSVTILEQTPTSQRLSVGDPSPQPTEQTLVFRLTVTDSEGNVTTDDVTITYEAVLPNRAPVADAGPDQTASASDGLPATLDASASTDPDGDTLSYGWVQTGGPTVATAPDGARLVVRDPPRSTSPTTLTFQLTATDPDGESSTDTVSIVYDADGAPNAVAGANQTVALAPSGETPTMVSLDASNSSDPEGQALTFAFAQISGPAVAIDASGATATVTQPATPGDVVIEVTVTDDLGQTDSDTITLTFEPAPNRAPTVVAQDDTTERADFSSGAPQQTVTLTASGTDPDDDTLSFSWTQVSGPATTVVPPDQGTIGVRNRTFITYSQPSMPGTVVYEVTADDGNGGTATDRVSVVWEDNSAPTTTAPATQPAGAVVPGQDVPIDLGTIADPDGQPVMVSVVQVSGPAVTISGANTTTPSFTAPDVGGTVVVEVTLSDGINITTRQISIPLTINAEPVAEAGADQTFVDVAPGTVVTLDGSQSSDPEGATLSYSWVQVGGPAVRLTNPNSATPSFSFPDDGGGKLVEKVGAEAPDTVNGQPVEQLVFELTVSDGVLSATDRTTVTINTNLAPTAEAGPDQALFGLMSGDTVVLDGTASSDEDGDTLTYAWTVVSGSATLSDATSPTPTLTYSGDGLDQQDETVVVELVVSDGSVSSAPDRVSLVFSDNMIPTADAGEDRTIVGLGNGDTVTLDGSGSTDPEDDALTYRWSVVSGNASFDDPSGVAPTLTYTGDGSDMTDETVEVQLIVNDGNSDSASDTVSLTFQDNQAPTANAGADIGPFDTGDTVTLNGGASSDPENDDLTYTWTQVSGPAVELSDANAASPTFTAPDVNGTESLVFQLVVSDGRVASEPDTVSVEIRATGTITIVQRVTGSDGSFAYTSDVSALNATLVTANGTGQLSADGVRTGNYTVTAADARGAGYALTNLTCSDGDSSADVTTRTAQIALAPGENVTCTFTSVNSREAASQAIREALTVRSQLILGSEPDIERRLGRLRGAAPAATGASVAGLRLPGSDQLGMSATISENNQNVSASLASANQSGMLAGQLGALTRGGKLDVWGEAQFSSFDFGQKDGDFSIIYLGADYLVSDKVLVGGLVQIDDFSLDATEGQGTRAGSVDGDGFMAGPYVTAKLTDRLYVDARAAWGSSDNSVNPLGTFSDEFDTSRSLYAATLTGEFTVSEQWRIRPEASIKHLSENQKDYTDSLGVVIPEQTVDLGELSFGPRLSRQFSYDNGWSFTPFVEATGIYSFGDEVEDVLGSETRLRLEGGAAWSSTNGVRIGVSGFADGLGGSDLDSSGVRISLAYAMK